MQSSVLTLAGLARRFGARLNFLGICVSLFLVSDCGSAGAQETPLLAVKALDETNWDQLVPQGKEVDAIYGDLVIANSYLKAVIGQPLANRHANMTVRTIGGSLIDLTTRHFESDQLSAWYPGRRVFAFSDLEANLEATTLTVNEIETEVAIGTLTVRAPGTETSPEYAVTYSLSNDSRFLTVTSTWKNTTPAEITPALEDDLRADAGKEDMLKTPTGTHELFWFHDIFWQQAYGIDAPGYRIRTNSNARESILVYEPISGQPVTIQPGKSFSLTRRIFVSRDLPGVLAEFDTAVGHGDQLQSARLTVLAKGQLVPGARVALVCGDQKRGTVVTDEAGSASVRLPSTKCWATVNVAGQEFETQSLTISDGELIVDLKNYTPGTAAIEIRDEHDRLIPAKIDFKGKAPAPTPNWGPETAEYFVRNLAYTPNGQVTVPLQSGEYEITVSHGPEYHAEFTTLKIEPGKTTSLNIRLPRLIKSPGWVSADFHSHSSPSGDNTGSQLGRVLNLAAEHLEFAPCTEHNRISTYSDHISRLDLEPFLSSVSGIELTGIPLPLNHQNAFPLTYHPRTQDGGAPVPDLSPETQMERLAAWDNNSVKFMQQNHPDIGWLFYDRNGDQIPDEGYSRSFGLMNVMEIHPIHPLLNPTRFDIRDGKAVENQASLNWLQLLNQGFRIYGVVNTDSHYNYHGSGGLRIWVKSSTDDPSQISSDEIRDAARSGHIIMSNGPYLEASFREAGSDAAPVISGQDLTANSKKVTAQIRVQCPNWLDVDVVMVLVNGRRTDGLTFSRDRHPEMFSKDTVRFDQTVDITLTEDAHLIVVTGHRTQVVGDLMGPMWGTQHPTALSNPVFVDVDGGGFTSNKDTLDIPLPVKFVEPK